MQLTTSNQSKFNTQLKAASQNYRTVGGMSKRVSIQDEPLILIIRSAATRNAFP
jgi:hypothetical protein